VRFARVFAICIAILLLFLLTTAPGHASTTPHGCARPAPPPIPGSPGPPPATPGIVLINEVLNNPGSNWNCSEPANTYSLMTDAWVELFNPQNQPFNLYAAHTSLDAGPNTFTFHFPFGAAIAARGYLVVFPDTYAGMLNAGNNLRLTIEGTEIDQASLPTLAPDTSYARIPDGSANWQITTNPTIDASNTPSTGVTPTPVSTKGSGGNSYNGNGYTTPTLVSGKQTGWTKLQLPATTDSSATPAATNPLVTSPSTASTTSAWDVPRRILLTVLFVALALSLFWCWKLFSTH
jgi:hypothetical protein